MPRALLAAALSLALAAGAARAAETGPYTFEKLNRTYTDLVGELPPVVYDPVTVTLASPSQTLHVRGHRAWLAPRADGSFDGRLEIDLLGKGALVADVDVAGVRQRLTDELLLPPQTLALVARVRLARVDGGYRVSAQGLPAKLEVAIQSKAINDVLALCDGAALLSMGALDCSQLARALTRPAVPMPAAADYFLADTDLTPADRATLDALLAR
jgi:hypothetical protein